MLKNATGYIFALALVALVGVVVLLCLNKAVPTELWTALTLLLGGGLGISQPTSSAPVSTGPAPAGVPVAAASAPFAPPVG